VARQYAAARSFGRTYQQVVPAQARVARRRNRASGIRIVSFAVRKPKKIPLRSQQPWTRGTGPRRHHQPLGASCSSLKAVHARTFGVTAVILRRLLASPSPSPLCRPDCFWQRFPPLDDKPQVGRFRDQERQAGRQDAAAVSACQRKTLIGRRLSSRRGLGLVLKTRVVVSDSTLTAQISRPQRSVLFAVADTSAGPLGQGCLALISTRRFAVQSS